jgi:structural maintenance of chromosome 4
VTWWHPSLAPPSPLRRVSNPLIPSLSSFVQVLENFKSYAGQQVIGPFHKNFAAVVGPNGSGKSNVIDALLFVFGKRAKQLRLNKVKELIHKSSFHTGLTSATVSVHFCEIQDTGPGDDEYVVLEGSQCVISRVARSDNTSTYRLNGKNCQFKDVATLLKSKGIDLDHNRFLILQGEVELISMMPPKAPKEGDDGLLEYLEDIIGSNKFVEQTNDVLAQVEQLSEQRNGHLQRVKGLQAELQGLEGAKQEAEALLAKEREIRRKHNILYQLNMEATRQSIEQRNDKVGELREKLAHEREQMAAATERMRELEAGLAAQQHEYNTVYSELQKAKDDFTAFERQDIQLKEERKHLQATRKKLAAKIEAEAGKQSDLETKIEQAKESIPNLELKIKELVAEQEQQNARLEEVLEERKGVTQELRTQLEVKQAELAPVRGQRNEFQNRLDTASTEVELLESSTKSAQERLSRAQAELEQLDAKEESVRTKLSSSQDELQQSKERLVEAEREDGDIGQKEVQLAARYRQCMVR